MNKVENGEPKTLRHLSILPYACYDNINSSASKINNLNDFIPFDKIQTESSNALNLIQGQKQYNVIKRNYRR